MEHFVIETTVSAQDHLIATYTWMVQNFDTMQACKDFLAGENSQWLVDKAQFIQHFAKLGASVAFDCVSDANKS